MTLYPLKFQLISRYRIWGGNKLNTELNKAFNAENIGESWEISDIEGDETKNIQWPFNWKDIKRID